MSSGSVSTSGTAIAPHRLDEKSPLMRRGGDFQSVNSFERDVERGVDADGDLRAVQVVVNRRGHSHDRKIHLRERMRALLRAVAARRHQRGNIALVKLINRLLSRLFRFELRTPRAPERGSAPLDYPADISRAERREISGDQPGKAVADAEDFPSAIQPRAHDGPDGRIHSRGVPAAR